LWLVVQDGRRRDYAHAKLQRKSHSDGRTPGNAALQRRQVSVLGGREGRAPKDDAPLPPLSLAVGKRSSWAIFFREFPRVSLREHRASQNCSGRCCILSGKLRWYGTLPGHRRQSPSGPLTGAVARGPRFTIAWERGSDAAIYAAQPC